MTLFKSKLFKKNKELIIIVTATVLPFGLVALGAWKAFELYRKNKEQEQDDKSSKDERPMFGSEGTS